MLFISIEIGSSKEKIANSVLQCIIVYARNYVGAHISMYFHQQDFLTAFLSASGNSIPVLNTNNIQ